NGTLNKKIVTVIKYVGSCPGRARESIIGRFVHNEVPTVKKRRVRIFNQTLENISEEVPYTDRKYKKNDISQKIRFDFGTNHRGSRFVIQPGINQLSYSIYNGKYGKSNMEVIKEGSFSVEVKKNPNIKIIQRDLQWKTKVVCVDQNGNAQSWQSLDRCKYAGSQRVGTCGGATVSSQVTNIWLNDRYKKKNKNRGNRRNRR
ncbi:MAG: hypothetical protein AAFW70_29305, partial [Cyanobacteria bacterium J06635_10]